MSKRWTDEEFKKILKERNSNLISLEEYQGAGKPILFKCNICGHKWKTAPRELTRLNDKKRNGCKNCSGKLKWTNEKFLKELSERNKSVKALEEYKGYEEKIEFLCFKCNKTFYSRPHTVLSNHMCPNCYKIAQTKTNEDFVKELRQVNPNLQPLEKYINRYTKILIKCNVCQHEWKSQPGSLLRGYGCPMCKVSKGERRIMDYLNKNNIEYLYDSPYFNDLIGIGGGLLRPDFIIKSKKIWIEYDGIFHYKKVYEDDTFEMLQAHDELKNRYAITNGWKLIRIPYWEYNNIEEILRKYINN